MNNTTQMLSRAPAYKRSAFGLERVWTIAGKEVLATEENDVRLESVVDEEGRTRYPACPDCGAENSIEDPEFDDDDELAFAFGECQCTGCGSEFADWRRHPDMRVHREGISYGSEMANRKARLNVVLTREEMHLVKTGAVKKGSPGPGWSIGDYTRFALNEQLRRDGIIPVSWPPVEALKKFPPKTTAPGTT